MWRALGMACAGFAVALVSGCASGPLLDNPVFVFPEPGVKVENPVFVPLGPESYAKVFEKAIDVLDDYFEIFYTNRYAGEIKTFPRIEPGYEQFWKTGNPDPRNRLVATLQSMRDRAELLIHPADDGGYFIQVTVYRELEDVGRPIRAIAGPAAFAAATTVERQFEVVDPTVYQTTWIPKGRNTALEQLILQRLKSCL